MVDLKYLKCKKKLSLIKNNILIIFLNHQNKESYLNKVSYINFKRSFKLIKMDRTALIEEFGRTKEFTITL